MYEEEMEEFEYDYDGEQPDESDISDEEEAPVPGVDPYRIFRKQCPPEKAAIEGCNLNETIQRHFETYLADGSENAWSCFLSASEPLINRAVSAFEVQYHIKGCFEDLKSAFLLGLMMAVQHYDAKKEKMFFDYAKQYAKNEMHRFVRTCYYGHSIPSDYQYRALRNVMYLYHENNEMTDYRAIQSIAKEIKSTPDDVQEYLQAGFQNECFVSYENPCPDSKEEGSSCGVLVGSDTLNPEAVYFQRLRTNAVLDAFDSLTYREREMVAMKLSFCPDCLHPHMMKGKNGTRRPKPPHATSYISIAEEFELIDGIRQNESLKGHYAK